MHLTLHVAKLKRLGFFLLAVALGFLLSGGGLVAANERAYRATDIPFLVDEESVGCFGQTSSANFGGDNESFAWTYLKERSGFNITNEQVAGILGNLEREAPGINPFAEEFTGQDKGGKGIAQWTAGRRIAFENSAARESIITRKAALDAAIAAIDNEADRTAEKEKLTGEALEFNLRYLVEEATDRGDFDKLVEETAGLSGETAISESVLSWERWFERAGVPALGQRFEFAKDIYARQGGGSGLLNVGGCNSLGIAQLGDFVFPLQLDQPTIDEFNRGSGGIINDSDRKFGQSGHPYAAYDIITPARSRQISNVLALMSGTVVRIGTDRCPGRVIGIYNEKYDVTVSHLHLSFDNTIVAEGDKVQAGDVISEVEPNTSRSDGCGLAHLHLDVAKGAKRPGCKRSSCPTANKNIFQAGEGAINTGSILYELYLLLPGGDRSRV